ncbi:glycosyltransferase family 2 protein [Nakamurella leprariae]|uniref:Glycosyltransferase family 2 protein n=1 Tax=Nakamurella leprariae TaxID=2803911 RepID=A0A939C225_9ACTN|nr:glycosyltransferase family 2 protein [Nakamurella leprariae]MBM9467712.1 glycosyltransferase family 2 protein [Nakamurella leprariae]
MSPTPAAEVAVVVRTKNRPRLLERAMASILAQTFSGYQVVVVNDAGDRGVVDEVVDGVRDRFADRITVVHNEVSRGREAAMNRGVEASTAPLLTILDDDDTWAPEFLERTVAHLDRRADLIGVATRAAVVHERIDGDDIVEERRELFATDRHQVALIDALSVNAVPQNSLVYRRAALSSQQPYDESLPVLSDWEFLLELLQTGEIGFLDGDPLAFWHLRETSVGDVGNSVYVDGGHEPWNVVLRDRLLRRDLERHGGLGVLLAIAEIANRDRRDDLDRAAAQGAAVFDVGDRVDAVRAVQSELAAAVQHLYDRHGEVVAALTEVNRNLVSQNNRLVAQLEMVNGRLAEMERRLDDRNAVPGD